MPLVFIKFNCFYSEFFTRTICDFYEAFFEKATGHKYLQIKIIPTLACFDFIKLYEARNR